MYSARPNERARKPQPKRKERKPQPKRKERKPFSPPVRCVITNAVTGERIAYNHKEKSVVYFDVATIFPSHNKAKKALWHICGTLPPKAHPGEPDRFIIIKGV